MRLVAGGLWLALALVAGVDVAAPAVVDPGWTAADWVLIISALTIAATSIIAAKRAGRIETAVNSAVPIVAAIQPKLDAITMLVDPRLLQELADVKLALANLSNRQSDRTAADAAQVKADDHVAMAAEVKAADPAAGATKP